MAFPILYVNLSGEMLYILEQRLQAQNVEPEKSTRGEMLKKNEKNCFRFQW